MFRDHIKSEYSEENLKFWSGHITHHQHHHLLTTATPPAPSLPMNNP
jgi:hypothetical protein